MSSAPEEPIAEAVERDRKRREEELLLLLLLLMGQATRYAVAAQRLGHDPAQAARNVIQGNPYLEFGGLAAPLSRLLATSYADGRRRTDLMMGTRPPIDPVTPDDAAGFMANAQAIANGMTNSVTAIINQAIADGAAAGMGTRKIATSIRQAVKDAGYLGEDPRVLNVVSERAIVDTHNTGMYDGGKINPEVWGFEFSAVLDKGTTVICRTCNGTRLPKGDPWFFNHTPSMHWGCRSLLRIIRVGSIKAVATDAPSIEPAPGFGHPWFGIAA